MLYYVQNMGGGGASICLAQYDSLRCFLGEWRRNMKFLPFLKVSCRSVSSLDFESYL